MNLLVCEAKVASYIGLSEVWVYSYVRSFANSWGSKQKGVGSISKVGTDAERNKWKYPGMNADYPFFGFSFKFKLTALYWKQLTVLYLQCWEMYGVNNHTRVAFLSHVLISKTRRIFDFIFMKYKLTVCLSSFTLITSHVFLRLNHYWLPVYWDNWWGLAFDESWNWYPP